MEKLTSLNFIADGKLFPPTVSNERLEKYRENNKRYKGKYQESRISVLGPSGVTKVAIKPPVTNYFKLVTDKTLGLLLNEKPNVIGSTKEMTKQLNDLIENTGFWAVLQDTFKTFSSHGDGVFFLSKDSSGSPVVNAVNPANWFKISSEGNIKKIKCHLLYQEIYKETFEGLGATYKDVIWDITHIRFLKHYKGYYIEQYWTYNNGVLGKAVDYTKDDGTVVPEEGKRVETGLSDFAVWDVNNSRSIDEMYGISDYSAFDTLVSLKEKKLAQLDGVTDKHYDPMITGPRSALGENEETGEVEFKGRGKYIGVNQGEEVKYVAWDAKTEAINELIDKCNDEIAILSEMGKAFMSGDYQSNVSGEALKTMIKSALDKVSRSIDTLDPVIKRVLCLLLMLEGVSAKPSDINIEWQDGISESDKTKSETIKERVESGTISKKRAMMKYDGMTEEQANAELVQIKVESGEVIANSTQVKKSVMDKLREFFGFSKIEGGSMDE